MLLGTLPQRLALCVFSLHLFVCHIKEYYVLFRLSKHIKPRQHVHIQQAKYKGESMWKQQWCAAMLFICCPSVYVWKKQLSHNARYKGKGEAAQNCNRIKFIMGTKASTDPGKQTNKEYRIFGEKTALKTETLFSPLFKSWMGSIILNLHFIFDFWYAYTYCIISC